MKNQLKNLLRGGVLMLAAVFAFAFTQPQSDANVQKFAMIDGEPVNITGQTIDVDYVCDDQPQSLCTYEEVNGVRIQGSETPGLYFEL